MNIAATATTTSTATTARSTTPTWQASNTSAVSAGRGRGGTVRSAKADRIWVSFIANQLGCIAAP
jgi:hypothetical protein